MKIEIYDGVGAVDDSITEPEVQEIQYEPEGTLCDVRTLYQKSSDGWGQPVWTKEMPIDLPAPVLDAESAQYALLTKKVKCFDGRRSLSIHSVVVQSERLNEFLKEAMKGYPSVALTLDRPEFCSPFRAFVHRWEEITKLRDEVQDPTTKAHVDMFYRIMDEELRDVIDSKNELVAKGVITFELVWTIIKPDDVILSSAKEGLRAYSSTRGSSDGEGSPIDYFQAEYVEFDGTKFGYNTTDFMIPRFEGAMPITSLTIFPLKLHPANEAVQEMLTARGKKWEALKGYHFRSYDSSTSTNSKGHVKNRVIIDAQAYNKFAHHKTINFDREIGEELDDAQRLIATPMLNGYALNDKKWRSFHVDHVQDIDWDEQAFESLVLPREQQGFKDVILAVAKAQSQKKDTFDDVIRGKGQGFIVQLSGPPGVGKTLTAESVAEVMRVPIYVMSAGDLGVEAKRFESKLKDILELVPKWGAILLLDEADVFMEARDSANLDRNELVSLFLGTLEYYEGILFLTTNRTQNIDPAFDSRVHLSIAYKDLDAESRRQVWGQFLSRSMNIEAITDEQLDQVAKLQLNGRQIKNIIKTAGLLACSKEREIRFDDLQTVLALRNLQK
ncbi:hypothetical protein DTO006G1_1692 [Penicillium roqueforti]|nr:hypothetical protein CBS147337_6460 [Penicillium roqueforti]KAI2763351.1 hypothetical protein DTO006G1_1692 [Penicillium roqueforti]KAI3230639.1 hypothetical protein DTO012A9_8278 [Penicillium roqueforti]KAI3230871.1 hypothetical protein DTO012A7_5773 [Penicillium roqueforti]KAI3236490.1 hypothetical protein CBS147310_3459 [Penicillium roqueforti]